MSKADQLAMVALFQQEREYMSEELDYIRSDLLAAKNLGELTKVLLRAKNLNDETERLMGEVKALMENE